MKSIPAIKIYTMLLILHLFIGSKIFAQSSQQKEIFEIFFDFEGYRFQNYRSSTPEIVDGGKVVTTEELKKMNEGDARPLLVDVLPVLFRHGRFLVKQKHVAIPGTIWLPNVGHGKLKHHWEKYFIDSLYHQTRGDLTYPIVFYCKVDCWMSWNAVKRAATFGYTNLYWYRDGIDDWMENGLPTEVATPYPLQNK
jgi:PQQ-dependent catabolism-associated CXXCW motif protein